MFEFLDMMGNYEERAIAHFESEILIVDTCKVPDGVLPYETGISCPLYHENRWIIVDAYDSKKSALEGHDKWVKIMTSKTLPLQLKDCANSSTAVLFTPEELVYNKIETTD